MLKKLLIVIGIAVGAVLVERKTGLIGRLLSKVGM